MKKIFLFILLIFCFIKSVNAEEVKLGTYKISSVSDDNIILVENNGNIELGTEEKTEGISWDVYANGSYYYIKSHDNSNLSLDIRGASKKNGTNIQTYAVNYTDAQKWLLNYAGDNSYYITSIMGSYNIDIYGGKAKNGANIQLYSSNGTNAQKWVFKRIDEVSEHLADGNYVIKASNNVNNVIDLTGANINNSTNIRMYSSNNTWAQIWNLKYNDGYYKFNTVLNENKVFDIVGGSFKKNGNVQLYQSNGTNAQKFQINKNEDGSYSIMTCDGLWAVDIVGGSSKSGANIQLYIPNGTKAQKFIFDKVLLSDIESGYYTINSVLNEDLVIGVNNKALFNGKNVYLRDKTDYNYTKWYIKKIERDIYTIANADNVRLVLDVYGNSSKNGTNVQLYSSNLTSAQKWIIRKHEDESYSFIGVGSNKAIDIYGARGVSDANIQIYDSNGTNAQKFKINSTEVSEYSKEYDDGRYVIRDTSAGKVLDVYGASKSNGANVQLYQSNSTKAQVWDIKYDGDGEYIISSLINPILVLTASDNNIVSSKNVDNSAQKWFFDKDGDNARIINKQSGKYLGVNNNNVILVDDVNDASLVSLSLFSGTLTYKGIDVSKHNGNIAWNRVASAVDFVVIRAGFADETFLSNGVDKYEDINYITNVEGCENNNIPYALYFYSYANKVNNADRPSYNTMNGESAESEASHMLNLMKKITDRGYYPTMKTVVYFDQEDDSILDRTKDKNVLTGMINKFCGVMKDNNHNCGVYASKYWFTDRVNVMQIADKHSIWVAQWPGFNTFDRALATGTSYNTTEHKLWQFSSEGSINGISGVVDLDIGYNIFD